MARLVFLGAGGIGIVAAEIARLVGHDVAGFLDDKPEKQKTLFCGARIWGGFDLLPKLREDGIDHAVIAFGHCQGRLKYAEKALSHGYLLPKLIHPSAVVSPHVCLGDGVIVMPGTVVNAGSRIGDNVILNTAATVDHECVVSEGVHIGPGCHLAGLVTIGMASWVGIGSIIRESVTIGKNVLLGAGSLVLRDIPDDVVAYGSPAKVIRPNMS